MIEFGRLRKWRSIAWAPLSLEAILFGVFMTRGSRVGVDGLAILAAGLGLQTATITKAGSLNMYTAFITGTLTKFAKSLVTWWFKGGEKPRQDAIVLFGSWLCYLFGAMLGIEAEWAQPVRALLWPIGVLILLVGFDLVRPLPVEEDID
jgi:uncharacterized membrane protein YoaK (UPF0700 family)